jgi:uncharacterized protein involved in exopolysaccharide biosynthesis
MSDVPHDWTRMLATARRAWWVPVLLAIVAGLVAVLAALAQPPDTRATERIIIAPTTGLDANYSLSDTLRLLTQPGIIGTLAEVLESQGILESASEEVSVDPEDYEVAAEEVAGSTVIEVHVDGPDIDAAQALAGAVGAGAITLFDDLYPLYDVRVLEPAAPAQTTSPSEVQLGVAGALVGAALGFLLLFLLSRRQPPAIQEHWANVFVPSGARHDHASPGSPTPSTTPSTGAQR